MEINHRQNEAHAIAMTSLGKEHDQVIDEMQNIIIDTESKNRLLNERLNDSKLLLTVYQQDSNRLQQRLDLVILNTQNLLHSKQEEMDGLRSQVQCSAVQWSGMVYYRSKTWHTHAS